MFGFREKPGSQESAQSEPTPNIPQNLCLPPIDFAETINRILGWANESELELGPAAADSMLDFFIDAIVEDIRSSAEANIAYRFIKLDMGKNLNDPRNLRIAMFPAFLQTTTVEVRRISSEGNAVVAFPSDRKKLCRAIADIQTNGYQRNLGTGNYDPDIWFPELRMIVVSSDGNHHSGVAAQFRVYGAYDVRVHSLTPFFQTVTTDGKRWVDSSRPDWDEPVSDQRFALLYTIAQRKATRNWNKFSDPF